MKGDQSIAPEIVNWLDKAVDAYYRTRIYHILDQVTKNSSDTLKQQWQELMEEMYGTSEELKQELIALALKEDRVTFTAKQWLQQFINSFK